MEKIERKKLSSLEKRNPRRKVKIAFSFRLMNGKRVIREDIMSSARMASVIVRSMDNCGESFFFSPEIFI